MAHPSVSLALSRRTPDRQIPGIFKGSFRSTGCGLAGYVFVGFGSIDLDDARARIGLGAES
jgi:hypothetical protein